MKYWRTAEAEEERKRMKEARAAAKKKKQLLLANGPLSSASYDDAWDVSLFFYNKPRFFVSMFIRFVCINSSSCSLRRIRKPEFD